MDFSHEIDKFGAQFRSIADAWCDTTTPHGKLILTVLGGLAEFERSLIMSRTKAGIEHARKVGKQFGRKPVLTASQKKLIAARHAQGETLRELASAFGVSEPTIWRAMNCKRETA